MGGPELTVRPYRPGDERAICRTFGGGETHRALHEWLWRYPWRPDGRTIMLAWADGELLAQVAARPARLHVDGAVRRILQLVEVSSRQVPGGWVSREEALARAAEALVERFVAGEGRAALVALRDGGLPDVVPGAASRSLSSGPVPVLVRREGGGRGRGRRLPYRAEPARDWEPRLDRLWARVRGDHPVSVVRDASRALVRLAGRPGVRYHRYLLFPRFSDEPVGFVAFRIAGGACRWVDVVWDHAHPGALELAAHLSKRLAREHGAGREELWLAGDPEGRGILGGVGFREAPGPPFSVLPCRRDFDGSRVAEDAFLTLADADGV